MYQSGEPAQAIQIFNEEGVVVLKNVLPATVYQPATDVLTAAVADLGPLFDRYDIPGQPEAAGPSIERLMLQQKQSIPAEHRHILLGHFPLDVRLDPVLQAIACHMGGNVVLRELLGATRLFAHMPPTARYVIPGNGAAAVPAHQDVSYNKHMGRFAVMWVPLSEIDDACGGVAVYPRSQGQGPLLDDNADVAPADGWLPAVDMPKTKPVVLAPLSPGDVVIMGDETIHQSVANRSGRIRLSVDFRIFSQDSYSSKHHLDLQTGQVIEPQQQRASS